MLVLGWSFRGKDGHGRKMGRTWASKKDLEAKELLGWFTEEAESKLKMFHDTKKAATRPSSKHEPHKYDSTPNSDFEAPPLLEDKTIGRGRIDRILDRVVVEKAKSELEVARP